MEGLESVWAASLQSGLLKIPRCCHCHAWNWYPIPNCRSCQHSGFEWIEVGLTGTLYSWTRVHRRFTSFELAVPYVVGLVEMADAPGVRIAARLHVGADLVPGIGDAVTLEPARNAGGRHWQYAATASAQVGS
jgi:uncharacterized protein